MRGMETIKRVTQERERKPERQRQERAGEREAGERGRGKRGGGGGRGGGARAQSERVCEREGARGRVGELYPALHSDVSPTGVGGKKQLTYVELSSVGVYV